MTILERGEKTAKKVVFFAFLFAFLKGTIAFISGSVVLLSDTLHSIGDVFEMFFVWLGFKISQRKPTERFPYGFYKVENIVSFLISFLILYAGFEIAKESYLRIFTAYELKIPQIALGIAILDAICIFLLGQYQEKIGREINSQSLIISGREAKLHLFSSLIVMVGILSSFFKIPKVEGIAGILLSLLVFKIGVEGLKNSIFALMDVSPSEEIEEKVKNILASISQIEGFSDLRLRKSGPFIFGEVKIKVKKFLEAERIHEISDEIEKKIKEKIPQLDSFLIHPEPLERLEKIVIVPVKTKEDFNSQISDHFARASFFAILKVKKNEIKSLKFKENPFKEKEIRAGLAVTKYLLEEKPDVLITKEIGPISFHSLRNNLIEVYQAEDGNFQQVVDNFLKGKLIRLKQPTRKKE